MDTQVGKESYHLKEKKYNEEVLDLLKKEAEEEKRRFQEYLEVERRKCDIEESKVAALNSLREVMEEFLKQQTS